MFGTFIATHVQAEGFVQTAFIFQRPIKTVLGRTASDPQ